MLTIFLIVFAAIIAVIVLAVGVFFINYAVKSNRSNKTIGKTKTEIPYTTDETGSIMINIPYDNYIKKCPMPEEYRTPAIREDASGENNSCAINQLISEVSENGGGTVYIPQGKYKVSTVELKSNVTLFVSENAELISLSCEENLNASSPLSYGVVAAHGAENITITGGGTISGNGKSYTEEPVTEEPLYALEKFNTYTRVIESRKRIRPGKKGVARNSVISLQNCVNANINNVIIHESAGWTFVIDGGRQYHIENIVIDNNMHVANTDGIDILNCSDVTIHHCFIATADDGVVLKPTQRAIKNVSVSDCEICSLANSFKIGTETPCDVENVTVDDCFFFIPDGMTYGYSGIAVESADGSNISNVRVNNIHMDGVSAPLLIWLGNRFKYDNKKVGSINNVSIRNVTAENTELPSAITGCKANGKLYKVGKIELSNISVSYRDTKENLAILHPTPDWGMSGYPEIVRTAHKYFINHKFSGYWDLPCYGIFVRYADVDYSGYSCKPRNCNKRAFACVKK